jgi:hypothetical protein
MTANGIIEFDWTPALNETLNLMFRRTNDDNTLVVRCVQASNTITMYKRVGGVESDISFGTGNSNSQTWTASTRYRITIVAVGTAPKSYVDRALKNVALATTDQESATGVKVSGFTTGNDLYCWKHDLRNLLPSEMIPT